MKKFNSVKAIRVTALVLYDILMIVLADIMSLFLRFDFTTPVNYSTYFDNLIKFLPITIIITLAVFLFMHLYQSLWQFASVYEYSLVFYASLISYTISTVLRLLLDLTLPRSCYFISFVIFCFAAVGGRVVYRVLRNHRHTAFKSNANMRRVMLIGAGDAANMLLREFNVSNLQDTRRVVCIIDDDVSKHGSRMYGITIVGGRDKIKETVEKYGVQEIIFAIPSAPPEEKAEILNICKTLNCSMKTLPGISQIVKNEAISDSLVNVDVNDLLGRQPVKTDVEAIIGYIKDKTVVVTGGGGSIGRPARQRAYFGKSRRGYGLHRGQMRARHGRRRLDRKRALPSDSIARSQKAYNY